MGKRWQQEVVRHSVGGVAEDECEQGEQEVKSLGDEQMDVGVG